MTVAQIVLLIVGIVFVVMSFFVIDRYEEIKRTNTVTGMNRTLTEEEMENLRGQIKELFEEVAARYQEEAEDKLSKMSNETIMNVNEFSNQVLAKIDQNNEEVVFLYNMLTNKEEEFKSIWSKIELARRENKELLDKIAELKIARARSLENRGLKQSADKQLANKVAVKEEAKEETKPKTRKNSINTNFEESTKTENIDSEINPANDNNLDDIITPEEAVQNNNDEILRLYKLGKSIIEISKELSIGQGEVKLVIDLYGQK